MAGNRKRGTVADAMDRDYRDRTTMFSVRHTNKDLGEVGAMILRGCACVASFFQKCYEIRMECVDIWTALGADKPTASGEKFGGLTCRDSVIGEFQT